MIPIHYELMQLDPSTLRDQTGYAKRIIRHVCNEMFVEEDQLKSRSRLRNIVEARQMAMWAIKQKTRIQLVDIGNMFNRDHSTVLWSVKTINQFIEINSPLGSRAIQIINSL